jgi:uncharacterized protein (UPF0248 family)
MVGISFDEDEQLKMVRAGLLDGEVLHAVYDDRGTAIGITNLRVIFQRESSVGLTTLMSLTSIPYGRILSVWLSSHGEATSLHLRLDATGHDAQLRGPTQGRHAHDLIVHFACRA